MTVQFFSGSVLFDPNANVAMDPACCCGGECDPNDPDSPGYHPEAQLVLTVTGAGVCEYTAKNCDFSAANGTYSISAGHCDWNVGKTWTPCTDPDCERECEVHLDLHYCEFGGCSGQWVYGAKVRCGFWMQNRTTSDTRCALDEEGLLYCCSNDFCMEAELFVDGTKI